MIAQAYPRLYHMAEVGTRDSIQRGGLLSTSALLDLYAIHGPERERIDAARRLTSVVIEHPVHGTARIRDNVPIIETALARTLDGMTRPEWYRTLNSRVYFWGSSDRLERLLTAPPNRARLHDVLIVDTAALLDRHAERVELAAINAAATHFAASYRRGAGTFQPIATYPWAERARVSREPLVEFTVPYAVPGMREMVLEVTTR